MKLKTTYIKTISVVDPDSKLEVEVEIYKLETGGMVGIDASFMDQNLPVYSAFDEGVELEIE